MNKQMLEELVLIKVKRDTRQKIKLLAVLHGMTMTDYLESIVNQERTKHGKELK